MMTLLLGFGLISPSASAAVSRFDIVKMLDGRTTYCQSERDLGRTGYLPLGTALRAEGGALRLTSSVAALVCTKNGNNFAFAERNLGDAVPGKDLNGNPIVTLVRDLRFLVTNSGSRVIGAQPATNTRTQALDITFPMAQNISRSDMARLERGETLAMRWELFLQGISSVQRGEETIPMGLFTGGAYRILFELRQVNGQLEVANLRLN